MNEKQLFLEQLLPLLIKAGFTCDSTNDTILVKNSDTDSLCTVEIKELGVVGTDGINLTHSVKIYTRCAEPTPGMLDLVNVGKWNSYTSMLSLIKDDIGLVIVAKVNLYEGHEEVIKHLYAPLAYAAVWLSFGIKYFIDNGHPNVIDFFNFGRTAGMDQWSFGIPEDAAKALTSVTEQSLKEGELLARQRGLVSFSDEKGMSLEFPWDRGAIAAVYDLLINPYEDKEGLGRTSDPDRKKTSLLMIENNQPHPLFGNGLLVRLQLPILVAPDTLPALVNEINLWEMNAADMPPFVGSWCIDPQFPSPAFVMFIPSMFSHITTIPSLLYWIDSRHKAAMTYLKQLGYDI